jgi:hypothetical protein
MIMIIMIIIVMIIINNKQLINSPIITILDGDMVTWASSIMQVIEQVILAILKL